MRTAKNEKTRTRPPSRKSAEEIHLNAAQKSVLVLNAKPALQAVSDLILLSYRIRQTLPLLDSKMMAAAEDLVSHVAAAVRDSRR